MNLENVPLFFYVLMMTFALLYGGFRHRKLYVLSLCSAWTGFLIQTTTGAFFWVLHGYPPAVNVHQLALATAWGLLAVYLLLYPYLESRRILIFFLAPLQAFIYLLGILAANNTVVMKPFFRTPWFALHIVLLVFGIAFFFLSFLYATIFIMQDHSLRHKHVPASLSIPSLEESEKWTTRFLLAGFPIFTLGLLSSVAYGLLHRSQGNWKPGLLEISSFLAWLVLGAAIYGWMTAKVNPRRRSWFVVAGAAFSLIIILGMIWH